MPPGNMKVSNTICARVNCKAGYIFIIYYKVTTANQNTRLGLETFQRSVQRKLPEIRQLSADPVRKAPKLSAA